MPHIAAVSVLFVMAETETDLMTKLAFWNVIRLKYIIIQKKCAIKWEIVSSPLLGGIFHHQAISGFARCLILLNKCSFSRFTLQQSLTLLTHCPVSICIYQFFLLDKLLSVYNW